MQSKKCTLCKIEITDTNDTNEHILPNAIGGRKKVRGFICDSCNNSTGHIWDSKFTKQLDTLCLFFNIKRERGSVPFQKVNTVSGDSIILHPNGQMSPKKPHFKETVNEKNVEIEIKARNEQELKSILKGVKNKYPNVDVEHLLDNVSYESTYLNDLLHFDFSIGGKEDGKSIVKSALAMVYNLNISTEICNYAISYLCDNEEPCFGYYYEKDLVINRIDGIPLHIIHIHADPKTQLILSYIEYFGCYKILLCLGDSYSGKAIKGTYAIDPVIGNEVDVNINLSNITFQDIRDAYDYKKTPQGSIEKCINLVIGKRIKEMHENEQSRVIENSVQKGFENCGATYGEILNEEHIKKLNETVYNEMLPYLLHILTRNKK